MGATTEGAQSSSPAVATVDHRPRRVVEDEALQAAIAVARSWRGVLRALGLPASSAATSRRLRRRADALGLSYEHFGYQQIRWERAELFEAVASARTWAEMVQRLGYSRSSGSARDSIRRACARQRIDTARLDHPPAPLLGRLSMQPRPEHLRSCGSMLVSAALTLAGHRVSWPLEPAVYDLLVDVSGTRAQRVQVKTTTRKVDGTWHCTLTRLSSIADGRYSLDDIDYFGIVDGDHVIYLLPAAVVGGLASIYTRAYQHYRVARLTT